MKKVILATGILSLLALASCDMERCTCHTFGAVQKKADVHKASASIEAPARLQ